MSRSGSHKLQRAVTVRLSKINLKKTDITNPLTSSSMICMRTNAYDGKELIGKLLLKFVCVGSFDIEILNITFVFL